MSKFLDFFRLYLKRPHVTLDLKGGIYMKTNKTMEQHIHNFSHEMRGPLSAASGTLQLLETKYPMLAEEKYLQGLSADLQYMEELLSDFTKCFGHQRCNFEYFSLDSMLKECALSFAASICEESISFTSHIPSQRNLFCGDRVQLKEVVHNLLKNALEATLPSGEIALHATFEDNQVILVISDTGCGIPTNQLPHIFEAYESYKPNGTGLGLYICKQIIKIHNGTIDVTSSPVNGTRFRVTLPTEQKCENKAHN